jgi:hypothetical protein
MLIKRIQFVFRSRQGSDMGRKICEWNGFVPYGTKYLRYMFFLPIFGVYDTILRHTRRVSIYVLKTHPPAQSVTNSLPMVFIDRNIL